MCFWFFKKKSETDLYKNSLAKVHANVGALGVCEQALANQNIVLPEFVELKDKLSYLGATKIAKADKIDDKIANTIGDLKIVVSKSMNDRDLEKAKEIINKINLLVAERKAITQ